MHISHEGVCAFDNKRNQLGCVGHNNRTLDIQLVFVHKYFLTFVLCLNKIAETKEKMKKTTSSFARVFRDVSTTAARFESSEKETTKKAQTELVKFEKHTTKS